MKQTNTYILKNTNSSLISNTLSAQLYDLNEKLSKMDYLKVIDIIWFFNYSPKTAWEKNGFPEDEYESSISIVQRELMRMLKLMYPATWKSLTESPASDAEKALSKALKSEIVFGFVRDKISCTEISTVEAFNRAIYLLTSDEEKNRFGGLKVIGFKKYEANFLKEVAPQIGEVLREVIDVNSLKAEEPKLFDNSPAEEPKRLDVSPAFEEVAQATAVSSTETLEDTTKSDSSADKTDFDRIVEHQEELARFKSLYTEYHSLVADLAAKGFCLGYLKSLLNLK